MLRKSLIWGLPLLLGILVATALLTRKTFHVESVVSAPPEAVWAVLMDTAAYPDWNPVFIAVDGTYADGATVTNTVQFPDGSDVEMAATVKAVVAGRELRQSGGMPGILTFDHRWLLEPVEGGTRVVQHEVDRGIGLLFWNADWIEPAYAEVLDALAERVVAQ